MSAHPLRLDHLVVSARNLDEGCQYVADRLGAAPSGGGAHPLMRTHNRLLGLWGGVYLEVIAIDPDAAPHASGVGRPRLFALDDPATHARLEAGPFLSHWVARVDPPRQLARWQSQYPERIAPVVPMTRGDFTWGLTVPDDGAYPGVDGIGDGLLPSLIQWDTPRHPADLLPESGIALKRLTGRHPRAQALATQLRWLGADPLISLEDGDGAPSLIAEFDTPDGPRTLP